MTEEERYLFDLQGYLVIENAIPPASLAAMNAWLDAQAERDPIWRGQTGNDHLEHLLTWGPEFRALLDNPRVLPFLKELAGDRVRLDHDYAIFLQPGGTGLSLHGGGTPFDPAQYYHCVHGRMFNGLTVATYALTDVPPGAGGFACIPGSHKSNFPRPASFTHDSGLSHVIRQVPSKAGDCILFTEALTHGTLPWQGPGVRRTLFFKYSPGHMSWSNTAYLPMLAYSDSALPEIEWTETQRILLAPPGVYLHPRLP